MTNPGLNGLILGSLLVGVLIALRELWRIHSEARATTRLAAAPLYAEVRRTQVIAPLGNALEALDRGSLATAQSANLLESIAVRLDDGREVLRYLAGLLVFLGLLGTFWGLLDTVSSIGRVIGSLDVGPESASVLDAMKTGLAAPLGGMGIAFSSSLFGLAGSLVLGFLDLQAGQAQNRFYIDLEDWLSTTVEDLGIEAARARNPRAAASGTTTTAPAGAAAGLPPLASGGPDLGELTQAIAKLDRTMTEAGSQRVTTAMAHLAESLQGLVQHMRSEQQMVRDWVEAQAEQQRDIKRLLERLAEGQSDRERA